MALVDNKGRIFNTVNLLDLVIVLALCAGLLAGFRFLTAPYRVAPPYATEARTQWHEITLALPGYGPWICDSATPGLCERDPRSGAIVAEIKSCQSSHGMAQVHLRINATIDREGRPLFKRDRLVPGRELKIETDTCILNGMVKTVQPLEG